MNSYQLKIWFVITESKVTVPTHASEHGICCDFSPTRFPMATLTQTLTQSARRQPLTVQSLSLCRASGAPHKHAH